MRKLSFKKLLTFALFCLFGSTAMAQVGIGTDRPPKTPTAILHVFGDTKIENIPAGGRDIITWEATAPNQYQLRRIALPANIKPGQTIKWGPNGWEVGNGTELDPKFFEFNETLGYWTFKAPTDPSIPNQVIIWDGTQWVVKPGGNGGGDYTGIRPVVVDNVKRTIGLDTTGLKPGQTWVWSNRGWVPGFANSSNSWLIGGNNINNSDTSFLGTKNAEPLRIRTNNVERMRVLANGQIVAGSTTTNARDAFSVYATGSNFSVVGYANGLKGTTYPTDGGGVAGIGNVYGVYGSAENATGITYGVMGETYSTNANAAGVYGGANGANGATYGVWGQTSSREGAAAGVIGIATETTTGAATFGVRGQTYSDQSGSAGVQGIAITGATSGVIGANQSETSFSNGVLGTSTGNGTTGGTYYGVFGLSKKSCDAVGIGVYGEGTTYGIVGRVSGGCPPQGTLAYAIFSQGNIGASGVKQFHIDHPADPANKYLNHAAIESNQALNLYSGNITTDGNGEATVEVPAYVQQINKEFRYTLTCMGQMANAVILKKMDNNRFVIKTDKPNVEVSWLLTGQRNDPYMQKNPFQAEMDKPTAEKGKYLHPELYNQPANKGVFYNPEAEKINSNTQTKPVTPRVPTRELNKR